MESGTLYSTLAVSQSASVTDIKHAYRKLASVHHPDKDQSEGSAQRFHAINQAYEVLSDPLRRQKYDKALAEGIALQTDLGVPRATLLMDASERNDTREVIRLLKEGAAVDKVGAAERTALMCAAGRGCWEAMEQLLAARATVNAVDEGGVSALMFVAGGTRGCPVPADRAMPALRVLLAARADIDPLSGQGLSALSMACTSGTAAVVSLLLSRRASPNVAAGASTGSPPLLYAAEEGHVRIIQTLLTSRANPNGADSRSRTALSLASSAGHEGAVTALLDGGADARLCTTEGGTALLALVEEVGCGSLAEEVGVALATRLLHAKADPTASTLDGRTPLKSAANSNKSQLADLFLTVLSQQHSESSCWDCLAGCKGLLSRSSRSSDKGTRVPDRDSCFGLFDFLMPVSVPSWYAQEAKGVGVSVHHGTAPRDSWHLIGYISLELPDAELAKQYYSHAIGLGESRRQRDQEIRVNAGPTQLCFPVLSEHTGKTPERAQKWRGQLHLWVEDLRVVHDNLNMITPWLRDNGLLSGHKGQLMGGDVMKEMREAPGYGRYDLVVDTLWHETEVLISEAPVDSCAAIRSLLPSWAEARSNVLALVGVRLQVSPGSLAALASFYRHFLQVAVSEEPGCIRVHFSAGPKLHQTLTFAAASAERSTSRALPALSAGNCGKLCGLGSKSNLNGSIVDLVAWDEAAARWEVLLEGFGARLRVRPENLQPLEVPAASLLVGGRAIVKNCLLAGRLVDLARWDKKEAKWEVAATDGSGSAFVKPQDLCFDHAPPSNDHGKICLYAPSEQVFQAAFERCAERGILYLCRGGWQECQSQCQFRLRGCVDLDRKREILELEHVIRHPGHVECAIVRSG